jgi:hypothetical protein
MAEDVTQGCDDGASCSSGSQLDFIVEAADSCAHSVVLVEVRQSWPQFNAWKV